MPVIGLLRSSSSAASPHLVTGLLQGLKEAGFVDGQDCTIEYRWGDNQLDRLPALVADLLRRPVAVIVVDTPSALAAKAATTTVPIVFVTGADPIRVGLVASLNRPGGNVTGVSFFSVELGAKRLGLLRELRPEAARLRAGDACSYRTRGQARGNGVGRAVALQSGGELRSWPRPHRGRRDDGAVIRGLISDQRSK
jgi:putative tryptophan/tyrosine transport system substrate-binding protein